MQDHQRRVADGHDASGATTVIRKATVDDVALIWGELRGADHREMFDRSGTDAYHQLTLGVELGEAYVGLVDGKYVCIWGISTDNGLVGYPWMLATKEIEENRMVFLRHSRKVVTDWLFQFPILTNTVDARNTLHLKWLSWLGFEKVATLRNYGFGKQTFFQFIRSRPCASLSLE